MNSQFERDRLELGLRVALALLAKRQAWDALGVWRLN